MSDINDDNLKVELDSLESEAIQSEPINEENQTASEQLQPETKQLISPIVSMACDLLAPNWGIQQTEKDVLCESYAEVIDKYFPSGLENFGVELNALLITAAIFGPRISLPRHALQPEKPIEDTEQKPTDNVKVSEAEVMTL
jgi:hypothetical protein